MSKCPFHHESAAANASTQPAPPHGDLSALKEGDEMCSHARKKLEARRAEEAAATYTPAGEAKTWTNDQLKQHFTSAYNQVATAVGRQGQRGDAEIAGILMQTLGYTKDEIDVIGSDVKLMQGTGNPHTLAALTEGESVVDLGSGFGIDAILAAARVGPTGRVVGIDLSLNEVTSALQRCFSRKLRNVDFRLGDIEDPPFASGFADAIISNGGFCLVPNKRRAFEEIFRVLKSGGRFSISCTVRLKELDMTLNWPSCMLVFMPLQGAREMLESIGFSDVVIDTSNSRMDVWDKERTERGIDEAKASDAKVTIHRGDAQYDFLKALDMNEYFARVNIFGRKRSTN